MTVPYLPQPLPPLDLPDISYIPGLNEPEPGVTEDDSGMSVVTVVGSQSNGLPWWAWAAIIAAGLYIWSQHDA